MENDLKHSIEEDTSLKNRLLTKEAYLNRATKKFFSFRSSINTPEQNVQQCSELCQSLLKDVGLYEFMTVSKSQIICETTDEQTHKYSKIFQEREKQISQVQQEIESLKKKI